MATTQEKYYESERGPDLRRNPETANNRHWTVNEMWEVHHEIARLLLLGYKNVDVAEHLSVSSQMVSNVRNSPVVQDKLTIMKGARDADTIDLSKEIRDSAPDALGLLKDIIRGDNEGAGANLPLRAKTAESMMDRAGYAAPQRKQVESIHYTLTKEEIDGIKEKAKNSGDVVDAVVIEEGGEDGS